MAVSLGGACLGVVHVATQDGPVAPTGAPPEGLALIDTALPTSVPEPTPTSAPTPTPLPEPTVAPTPRPLPDCGGSPVDVDGHGAAFADPGPDWAAGDLMERIAIDDDQTLWIFGDTFSGEVTDGALAEDFHFAHSALLVERDGCFERILGHDGGSWIPSMEAGIMLWPQEAVMVGGELHVFAIEVVRDDTKPEGLNFAQVGGVIAVYRLDDLTLPRTMVFDVPTVRGNPFGWGVHEWEGHLYLYAHEEPTGTFVARSRPETLRDPETWEFWNGAAWVAEPAEVVSVAPYRIRAHVTGDGADAIGAPLIGAMVPVLDERLHVLSAPAPEGPWTLTHQVSLQDLRPPGVDTWAYEPLVVEEQADGGLVFAVNFLPKQTTLTLTDVSLYGPRFIEVSPAG